MKLNCGDRKGGSATNSPCWFSPFLFAVGGTVGGGVGLVGCSEACTTQGSGEDLGLGLDKRTGTFGSHVIDGVEDLQEPGKGRRFLLEQVLQPYQRLGRDFLVGAAS